MSNKIGRFRLINSCVVFKWGQSQRQHTDREQRQKLLFVSVLFVCLYAQTRGNSIHSSMEQKKPPTLLFPVRKKLVKKKFHKKIDRQTGVRHTFFSTVTRNLIFFFFFYLDGKIVTGMAPIRITASTWFPIRPIIDYRPNSILIYSSTLSSFLPFFKDFVRVLAFPPKFSQMSTLCKFTSFVVSLHTFWGLYEYEQ